MSNNNRLKEIRESLKMSQEELSEKSEVSRATISNLETGKPFGVLSGTMIKIADALEKPVSEFFFTDEV